MHNIVKVLEGYKPLFTETFLASFGVSEVIPLMFTEKHFVSGQVMV